MTKPQRLMPLRLYFFFADHSSLDPSLGLGSKRNSEKRSVLQGFIFAFSRVHCCALRIGITDIQHLFRQVHFDFLDPYGSVSVWWSRVCLKRARRRRAASVCGNPNSHKMANLKKQYIDAICSKKYETAKNKGAFGRRTRGKMGYLWFFCEKYLR